MLLRGKRAIVTGAGAGLGKAIAMRFAAEGAAVIVSDRDEKTAAAVTEEIRKGGGTAHAVRADVTREGDVRALVEQGLKALGGLDVLVNNAGIEIVKPVTEVSEEEWDRLMAINVKGVFFGCKHAIPHLAKSRGCVLNMASAAGLIGWPLLSLYCASKGAVVLFTKALAQEHRETGIRFNALCPMVVDTDMGTRFVERYEKDYGVPVMEALKGRQGRIATPAEVASAAVFLASDDASFVNGCALPLDNGGTAG